MVGQRSIAVLGAGSWGTALALVLARNGLRVGLWGLPEDISRLTRDRENRRYLPGIPFPENLLPDDRLERVVAEADDILLAVPSAAFSLVLQQLSSLVDPDQAICWATKGLDPASGGLLSFVVSDLLGPRPMAVLSGPTFAKEVAAGLPTAMTVAATDQSYADRIADYLHCDCFRAYTAGDIIGVQVGGAAKNIMAIGAGISDGLGFGANARAALITRGLAEIIRLGVAMGAERETFMGLTGLGDLVLTCTDDQSRNRRMGLALARGLSVEQAKSEIGQSVEGVGAAKVIRQNAQQYAVDMPITEQIYRVLHADLDAREAVTNLLDRSKKSEFS